jgi:hypothetical protein
MHQAGIKSVKICTNGEPGLYSGVEFAINGVDQGRCNTAVLGVASVVPGSCRAYNRRYCV